MSSFWNRRTRNLSPYIPGEQPRDRKFIKLNTNENPYAPSPKVIAAIEEALRAKGERLRLYPDPLCTVFREAVAEAYGVKPSQVFPGNGSDEVLAFVFGALFEDSLPVLFPDISYSFYPVYAGLWNIPFKTIPLKDDFSINLEDYYIEASGVIISNPNAPTGRALPAAGFLPLARKLEKENRALVVDEAYAAFGAETLVPHIAGHPNLLTVHTLSKSASLAGLRAGFAIGSEELIEGLFRVRDSFNSYTMDTLAQLGAAAAVLDKNYYDEINKKVIATRDRTAAALSAMGFDVIPSKSNFLFISGGPVSEHQSGNSGNNSPAPPPSSPPGVRSPPAISGPALFQALRERGILVRHFNKPRIADYLRVSIGTDEDMDTFIAACKEIIGNPN
jgi:histidinol-phosphate aminotransferase